MRIAPWEPPGHKQVPIWPGAAPDAQPIGAPENETAAVTTRAASTWTRVGHVDRPTVPLYAPRANNTSAAVVVLPGGGYRVLAMDIEGTEVCDWLTSRGITCVLLKYRVPGLEPDAENPQRACVGECDSAGPISGPYPKSPMALEDAQRTIAYVRLHAEEWDIDPQKIGVLGFSAGGHLVAALSTHWQKRLYPPVDAADRESCRPNFAMALYPGPLSIEPDIHTLNPAVPVTGDTPPTFLVQAEDDPVDRVENSLVYYAALRDAHVSVEMHLFPRGGHAFALRAQAGAPISGWTRLAETWMRSIGVASE